MNFPKRPFAGAALAAMIVVAAFALSGCGLFGAEDETPPGQTFTYNGNTWRVSDIRSEGRIVIVAVDPRLAGLGTEAASRHAVAAMPEPEYRAAATGWLTTTGRFCTPGAAQPINDDEPASGYQYDYSCWNPA
jgi:hypothetical protein